MSLIDYVQGQPHTTSTYYSSIIVMSRRNRPSAFELSFGEPLPEGPPAAPEITLKRPAPSDASTSVSMFLTSNQMEDLTLLSSFVRYSAPSECT